jgi:hypothetical protein
MEAVGDVTAENRSLVRTAANIFFASRPTRSLEPLAGL